MIAPLNLNGESECFFRKVIDFLMTEIKLFWCDLRVQIVLNSVKNTENRILFFEQKFFKSSGNTEFFPKKN